MASPNVATLFPTWSYFIHLLHLFFLSYLAQHLSYTKCQKMECECVYHRRPERNSLYIDPVSFRCREMLEMEHTVLLRVKARGLTVVAHSLSQEHRHDSRRTKEPKKKNTNRQQQKQQQHTHKKLHQRTKRRR